MNEDRTKLLLDRAIFLIEGEWGYNRERAIGWLNDEDVWNEWEYGGKWIGREWVPDETIIRSTHPIELRTNPLPNAETAKAERSE